MKKFQTINSQLTLWFMLIIIVIMGLSWVILPAYYDYIVKENFFETIETIEKRREFGEAAPITSDMYTVQNLLIDSKGRILTRREDIFSLRFFSESFLNTLSKNALSQNEKMKRYVMIVDDIKVYAVITKTEKIYHVSYMYDIYGNDFASRLVMGNMILLLFLAVIGSLIMFYFSKRLVNRIVKMRSRVKSIADGLWEIEVQVGKKDELGDLEHSFELMRQQLIAQDNYKNDMYQNISHELKTPIMVISTYAQGVKDNIYPEGDLSKTIDVILDESNKLDDKVQKILYLNKLQFLKDKPETVGRVKMKPLIESLVNRFQNIRDISFELALLEEVEFIGDYEKWRIALENILSNGIRYANSKITIQLETNRLVIINDGPDIEFENTNDVFLAFKKGKTGHNGIGLKITKSIVELYNFQIGAQNVPQGVMFIIESMQL